MRTTSYRLMFLVVLVIDLWYVMDASLELFLTGEKDVESLISRPATRAEMGECRCVHCSQDEVCGGLWKGDAVGGDPHFFSRINIVVSHCLYPLDWLKDFTAGYTINNITIISKCDKPVVGAPEGSIIVRLPNVGRCDHSYAHWLSEMTQQSSSRDKANEVVVFLKDVRSDESIHQPGLWRSLPDMLRIASKTGFACGMKLTTAHGKRDLSYYHEVSSLITYGLSAYPLRPGQQYDNSKQQEQFPSKYDDLGQWLSSIGAQLPSELSPVCYGGTFAVAESQISKQNASLWSSMEQSLSRSDNIEEGHFAERAWAFLLSNPLSKEQISLLRDYSDDVNFASGVRSSLARFLNLTCSCPERCNDAVLKEVREGRSFSCEARVRYLMTQYRISETDACLTASTGATAACGPQCNPNICSGSLVTEA